jgi:hypothetical protein
MAGDIALTPAHITGLISAAVQREHAAASTISVASHGEVYRPINANDKPTPAAARFKALEALWNPVLQQVYASPAGQALKGTLPDPQIGTTRVAIEGPAKEGAKCLVDHLPRRLTRRNWVRSTGTQSLSVTLAAKGRCK